MNTVPSSSWHLLAALAQLAHESIPDLAALATRVAALLAVQPACPQGVLVRTSQPRAVLAHWGMSEQEAQALLPPPSTNGAKPFQFPAHWRSAEIGAARTPGLLALRLEEEGPLGEDFILALGAQISLLWQAVLARSAQNRHAQLDSLISAFSAAGDLAAMRALAADTARPDSPWTVTVLELDGPIARSLANPTQMIDAVHPLAAEAPLAPAPLPDSRPDWLDQRPGLHTRIGSEEAPRGLVVVTGDGATDAELQAGAAALARYVAATYERLVVDAEFAKRERALASLNDTLQGLAGQLNSDEFILRLIAQAVDLLDASGGGVYFYDQATSTLELRTIYQVPQEVVGIRLKLGEGVAGKAAAEGQAFAISDYRNSAERSPVSAGDMFSAISAAPLYEGELLVGVLSLVHTEPGRSFSANDLNLLESFAAQASLAIRTARLF
ncbi:MAG TPA: GAF domain-containing protein, partial [Herpetosiphonaceae bacterium]